MANNLFIAPNGKLYYETKMFWKAYHEIMGVSITELWKDAYQANLDKGTEVLFPVDFCCPFPVVDHSYSQEEFNGFKNGGGFRLNLNFEI